MKTPPTDALNASIRCNGVECVPSRATWPPAWISETSSTPLFEPTLPPDAQETVAIDSELVLVDGILFPPEMIRCNHNWQDTAESDGRTRRFCKACYRFGGFILADGSVVEELPQ